MIKNPRPSEKKAHSYTKHSQTQVSKLLENRAYNNEKGQSFETNHLFSFKNT